MTITKKGRASCSIYITVRRLNAYLSSFHILKPLVWTWLVFLYSVHKSPSPWQQTVSAAVWYNKAVCTQRRTQYTVLWTSSQESTVLINSFLWKCQLANSRWTYWSVDILLQETCFPVSERFTVYTRDCVVEVQWRTLTWWRHQMETFSALLAICAGNSPVPGEFPALRPVTWSFDVFFDLRLNKRVSKQSWGWWFETLSHPLWRRHYNEVSLWRTPVL